ncbi:hypothetical protein, partial [Duganella callida]|uniref:hypothetical protein n=1 Tax=Duganella callida TaxID=2561932 RepID=UPI0014316B22
LGLSASPMLGSAPVGVSATLGRSAEVSWSLGSGNPGTLSATSGANVTYTPPATRVGAITPVTITATSSGVSQSVRLALYPDAGAPGLSLLAGSLGSRAIIDGDGSAARFNDIGALAADSNGATIVADRGDIIAGSNPAQTPSAIRQISATGVVTTLAAPAFGHADGSGAAARLGTVTALAVAPDASIILIDNDTSNYYLRRLTRAGSLSTIATLAPAINFTSARVVVDGGGTVSVLTPFAAYRVAAGVLTLLAGDDTGGNGSVDGVGPAARFSYINEAVADSAGNIYLIDNFSIRKIAADGTVSTLAGMAPAGAQLAIDGSGNSARFGDPTSLALDNQGNLLVLDREPGGRSGYLIRQVSSAGVVTTPYTGADPKSYGLLPPPGVTTASRRLTVTSSGAIVLASSGQLLRQQNATGASLLAGLEGDSGEEKDGPGANARFVSPSYLAADLSGNVFVLDQAGSLSTRTPVPTGLWLRKISPGGQVSTVLATDSQLTPTGIAADADSNIYVSMRYPNPTLASAAPSGIVYKISPQGVLTQLAGGKAVTPPAPVDGVGTAAFFTQPTLEGIDSSGNLYLTDVNPYVTPATTTYRQVTPQGVVSTIAALPAGLKRAPDAQIYSADAAASVVYRLAADGSKTVAAGIPGVRGTRLGALPGGLDRPQAVAPAGPDTLVVISGAAVLRLVLPH